jgi:hypothetical protein
MTARVYIILYSILYSSFKYTLNGILTAAIVKLVSCVFDLYDAPDIKYWDEVNKCIRVRVTEALSFGYIIT